jgi:hypothetical protein
LSKKLKRLFLLTDGEVDSPHKVIELAKKHAEKVKIHSFGVDTQSSRSLIIDVAKAGRGSASFVDEYSDDLKGLVITALKKASEPSYYDCNFNVEIENKWNFMDYPKNGIVGEAFRNYPLNYFMIVNKT